MDNKLSPTARKGFLLGFDEFNRNYLVFDYESHRIINVHDVTFNEHNFPERGDDIPETFSIEQEEEEAEPDPSEHPAPIASEDDTDDEIIQGDYENPIPTFKKLKVILPKPPIDHPDNPQYLTMAVALA
ncbi:hypothetical protein H4Q26_007254 [Puccinia striiformis f. sp. tritici PST-130]|nr:hypothetical protein H4Q26_007254 [Puccinia striiformis f. sp. tritici PST-130]